MTDVVRPERSFVLVDAGSCSFCSQHRADVRSLLGTVGRATTICDQCLVIGWDLIADEVGLETPSDLRGRVSFPEVPFDDELFQAHVAEVSRRLADERRSRKAVPTDPRPSFDPARVAQARAAMAKFRCSFCDAHRADVLKIISGAAGFICDVCIGDATAVVMETLPA